MLSVLRVEGLLALVSPAWVLSIHRLLDCSLINRERELGLDRRETGEFDLNARLIPLVEREYGQVPHAQRRRVRQERCDSLRDRNTYSRNRIY